MRRIDHDGHVTRQGRPPFKVLAIPDVAYLPPPLSVVTPPPPPRAPEPYKVVPSSTSSFGRAHRRSSFVILAETRPPTPESAGDASSPTLLLTGRVSPFRGRGFKGPPPRSMSRPQSPEVAAADERRRGRAERRVSVSQQNSPRRSMIPQPTYRQRSTSLTKTGNDRSPSPRIGRRNDSKTNISNSRNRLNAIDPKRPNDTSKTRLNKFDSRSRTNLAEPRTRFISNSTSNLNETRRNSMTTTPRNAQRTRVTTRLSPIQGTPTKPEKTTSQTAKEERANDSTGLSPTKISTSKTSPRNNAATRKNNQNRSSSKERVTSPSKIPLKMSRTGSFSALNASKAASTQSSERSRKVEKPTNKTVKEGRNDKQQTKQTSSVQDSVRPSRSNSHIEIDGNPTDKMANEVDLMNLLKQSSSHATSGTSSERLVNTTTSTAVQPLHIDANTLSVERNDGSIAAQQKERPEVSKISPASKDELSVAARRAQNAVATSEKSAPLLPEGQSIKINQSSSNPGSDNRNLGAGGSTDEHSKSGGKGQSARNIVKTNDEGAAHQRSSNQSSANQRAGKNGQSSHGTKTSNGATSESPEVTSTTAAETKSRSVAGKATAGETPASDRMPTVMENSARIAAGKTVEGAETKTAATAAAVTTTSSTAINNSSMSDSTTNSTTTHNKTTTSNAMRSNNNNVNCAIGSTNACVNSGAVRTRNDNRGSDASLKSSTGVSTDSIESVRSTDTGVSVNTVRVVSSPKVKTGVHVVKRSQEIETLSGNIVHIEQNGEPVAPASGNDKQGDSEKLLARWRRSLSWYCRCCRGMRCLACRRDPKGLLWARNQGRTTAVISDTPPAVETVAQETPAPAANALSRWSRLKTRCKCTRLRTIKCCTRKARIAPAEPTVCFPPERKFGALCRRMFSCCRCKRADTQQRTRNVRAKHSLTSVAPPPLSEEPKAKLPDILVEHNSVMRGAIPCLPVPLAWFCLVWNVLLPGSGTVWSGLFNLCTGQPRFSAVAGLKSRLGAFVVNLVVGVGQLFTVLFCLVGWGWSIWWGVTMIRLARKYKRFKASEAASNDPEARGGESGVLPPGVPSQALRGMERAR